MTRYIAKPSTVASLLNPGCLWKAAQLESQAPRTLEGLQRPTAIEGRSETKCRKGSLPHDLACSKNNSCPSSPPLQAAKGNLGTKEELSEIHSTPSAGDGWVRRPRWCGETAFHGSRGFGRPPPPRGPQSYGKGRPKPAFHTRGPGIELAEDVSD